MRELSLNVMDVAQNSITAGAGLVTISVEEGAGRLAITIEDDGCGMTAEQVERVQNPFYTTRTTRDVGLGVPLFKMASEMTGGSFSIRSEKNVGTVVRAEFDAGHIDMTPLGDMNATLLLLISCNPNLDFLYRRVKDGKEFALDTREIRAVLEGVPLDSPDVVAWIKDSLAEGEGEVNQ
jgi:hypothetical protein